ncbi:MAG: NADH-quinone oxidoreductase subunit C, partial [Nitrospira sp.]|nr:NADH-quinone oxidoreductase subunit C [Nitrospira sp.]
VVYQLLSLPHRRRIRLKARVTEDVPNIASVTGIWKGAEFMEREVYDLMGIIFVGHPDLRRILLPEDYEEGHPLRKDFPTEGRGWRSSFRSSRVWTKPQWSKRKGSLATKRNGPSCPPNPRKARTGAKNCC